MSRVILVFLKSLGMSFAIMAVVLVIALVATLFWVRTTVRGKVYCYVLAENKQMRGHLLKPQSNCVVIGSGENAPKLLIHPSKQFWSFYPPGFPKFTQEPVPTYFYVAGNAEPLDPYDRKSLISPESLRKISDEAMLKQTWKDVKESIGLKGGAKNDKIMLILILVAVGASCAAAFIAASSMGQLNHISALLGG